MITTQKHVQGPYTANYMEQLQLMQNIKNWRYKQVCTDNTRIKHYRKLQAIKAQIKELEKEAKKEEQWIFEEYKNQEPILDGKKIIVQYDKKSIDSKRLESEFPDIYKRFLCFVPIKYVNTKATI